MLIAKCVNKRDATLQFAWRGLVHYTVPMGWMIRESCTEFLTGTATHLIFDGAPAHGPPEQPRDNANLRILPPYSPFLNIVQQAISCTKASIKAYTSRPAMQERFADRNAHLLLGESQKTIACSRCR